MFPRVPFLIDTVLLPLEDQIIYDGQCQYYNIVFGGGITRRLNESYQLAKAQSGIHHHLVLCGPPQAAPSEEEQLRFYLRTARNRRCMGRRPRALTAQLALETLYQQERAK